MSWFALHPTSYDAKSLKTEEQDAGDYGLTQKKSVVQFVQEWHNLAEDIFNEDEQVQVFLQVSVRWKTTAENKASIRPGPGCKDLIMNCRLLKKLIFVKSWKIFIVDVKNLALIFWQSWTLWYYDQKILFLWFIFF